MTFAGTAFAQQSQPPNREPLITRPPLSGPRTPIPQSTPTNPADTDFAMRATTDAVQLHGGYGYMQEYPVERFMREAKALQIVEGTNQVQRMIIGRRIAHGEAGG